MGSEAEKPTEALLQQWRCTKCSCLRGAHPEAMKNWNRETQLCFDHGCPCCEHAPYLGGPPSPSGEPALDTQGFQAKVFHAFMSKKEPLCEHDYSMFDDHEEVIDRDSTLVNCPTCLEIRSHSAPRIPPQPPQVVAAQESVSPSGYARVGNVSALAAIQVRKKPAPWVESCDPLHWIPDA